MSISRKGRKDVRNVTQSDIHNKITLRSLRNPLRYSALKIGLFSDKFHISIFKVFQDFT